MEVFKLIMAAAMTTIDRKPNLRRLFQFHVGTAVIMTLAAGFFLLLNMRGIRKTDVVSRQDLAKQNIHLNAKGLELGFNIEKALFGFPATFYEWRNPLFEALVESGKYEPDFKLESRWLYEYLDVEGGWVVKGILIDAVVLVSLTLIVGLLAEFIYALTSKNDYSSRQGSVVGQEGHVAK